MNPFDDEYIRRRLKSPDFARDTPNRSAVVLYALLAGILFMALFVTLLLNSHIGAE